MFWIVGGGWEVDVTLEPDDYVLDVKLIVLQLPVINLLLFDALGVQLVLLVEQVLDCRWIYNSAPLF